MQISNLSARAFYPLAQGSISSPNTWCLQMHFCLVPPPNQIAVATAPSRASRNEGAQPTQPTTDNAAYIDASPASPPTRPSAAAMNS